MSPSRTPSAKRTVPKRTRRSGSYRRIVTAGDIALGVGLAVTRPARRVTTQAWRTAERVGTAVGTAFVESLPEEQRGSIQGQVDDLAKSGRQARVDTVEALVGTIVAETLSSDIVRSAMVSAASQAMDEVVDASMPTVVEQLRQEIATVRLEEMVRASVDRMVPEIVERELAGAIASAAGLPGRTARGLARLPSSVLRAAVVEDEGYDE